MTHHIANTSNSFSEKRLLPRSTQNYPLMYTTTSILLRSDFRMQRTSMSWIESVWMGSQSFTPSWYLLSGSVSSKGNDLYTSIRASWHGTYIREGLLGGVQKFDTMNQIGLYLNLY